MYGYHWEKIDVVQYWDFNKGLGNKTDHHFWNSIELLKKIANSLA